MGFFSSRKIYCHFIWAREKEYTFIYVRCGVRAWMWKEWLQSIRRINIYCYKFYMLVWLTNLFTMLPKIYALEQYKYFHSMAYIGFACELRAYVCMCLCFLCPLNHRLLFHITYHTQHFYWDTLCFLKHNLKFTCTANMQTYTGKMNQNRFYKFTYYDVIFGYYRTVIAVAVQYESSIYFICFFCPA